MELTVRPAASAVWKQGTNLGTRKIEAIKNQPQANHRASQDGCVHEIHPTFPTRRKGKACANSQSLITSAFSKRAWQKVCCSRSDLTACLSRNKYCSMIPAHDGLFFMREDHIKNLKWLERRNVFRGGFQFVLGTDRVPHFLDAQI